MKIFICAFLCCSALCGCAPKNVQNRAGVFTQRSHGYTVSEGRLSKVDNASKSAELHNFEKRNDETALRARHIAKEVEKIENIENATAVITGNTAIIGIALKEEVPDDLFLDLKRIVEARVLRFDPEIDHAAITSAPELVKKIIDVNGDGENTAKNHEAKSDGELDVFFRKVPEV